MGRPSGSIHGQSAVSWEVGRVSYMCVIQDPVKCILVWRSRVVGNLDPGLILGRIVIYV